MTKIGIKSEKREENARKKIREESDKRKKQSKWRKFKKKNQEESEKIEEKLRRKLGKKMRTKMSYFNPNYDFFFFLQLWGEVQYSHSSFSYYYL